MKYIFGILILLTTTVFGQNINISNESNFNGEPYLAINPTNPQNIMIAWMHIAFSARPIRTRSSFDGGLTWGAPVDLPVVHTNTADPTMAFDNSGNLYLCFIDHLGTSSTTNNGAIYSYKSTDGGLTWGNQAMAIDINADGMHQPIDRPWLVCDRSGGPNDGTLYLTTKTVSGGPAPYHPYFLQSTDGALTWSPWKYVDTLGWLSNIPPTFAAPAVSANGNFSAVYPSYVASQNPLPRYLMAIYDNANDAFTYKASITNIPSASNDSAKRGWQFIADPSDGDHFAFFYIAGPNGDLDIYMTETYDNGDTWASSIRINDDPVSNGILQDMVWASFDEDADLVVCWRDRRNGGGPGYNRASEIYGAVRWKDSLAFSPSFIISDTLTPYNNILSQAGNDFLCQQMHNDTLYITWGDTRTGFLNIWFDKIALGSGLSTGVINLANSELPILKIYPNPANERVTIDVKGQLIETIQIFNGLGQRIKTITQNNFTVSDLPSGTYFIVTETRESRYTNKLVVN